MKINDNIKDALISHILKPKTDDRQYSVVLFEYEISQEVKDLFHGAI